MQCPYALFRTTPPASAACLPLALAEDSLAEIRAALDMPGSGVRELCARIRTLRQTEAGAKYKFERQQRRTP